MKPDRESMMHKTTRRGFLAGSGSVLFTPALAAQAPPERHLFGASWPPARLERILLPREKWKPCPASEDRAAWQALPEDARQSSIRAGERRVNAEWPSLPATLFLQYALTGNRSHYERVRGIRRNMLSELVLAECVEGRGRFVDDIVNGLWTTCEETYWGVPAHVGDRKSVV